MTLNLDIIRKKAGALGCDFDRIGTAAGLDGNIWATCSRHPFADPKTVGRLAAFLGCDPEDITLKVRAQRTEPCSASAVIDGYRVECAMAREDMSFDDIRDLLGFDVYSSVRHDRMREKRAEVLARALWLQPRDIIVIHQN